MSAVQPNEITGAVSLQLTNARIDLLEIVCKHTTQLSYVCGEIMPKVTLEERIEMSITRSKPNVFLRKDFERFGGYDQVGRALRSVMLKGLLLKAGYGVYVKARKSSITGNPIPVIPLVQVGLEALVKMGVPADIGSSAKQYMSGETTQMPVAAVVNIGKSRVARKLSLGGKELRYEK
jgi:hypothetical protein